MEIHRCRFVPYRPQSINTLAFSHRSNHKQQTPQDLRLALGRENGDVEIWNPSAGKWVQEKILRGSRDRTVEHLAWTQDLYVDQENTSNVVSNGPLRLFSSGGSPAITEWDLITGLPKRHAEGNLGDIWCFAAQPQWKASAKESDLNNIMAAPSQLLVAGCADGTMVLFTTADDTLQFLRVLSPASGKKTKVISITWRDRGTVVAGYENGTIRVIDVPTRTTIRTMTLGKSADTTSCVVWTVHCLSDGTILSGDSSGELKIWDSKTLSLAQRLKAHDADVLDISSSASGSNIFTTGVDRRIVSFKQLATQADVKRDRWQRLMHRRFHQHDVKTIASFESKDLSVLVSGGMDTIPIVMPLRKWEQEYHRTLSHLPQRPQMSCSSELRLMLTWWNRELLIWHLPELDTTSLGSYNASQQANHQLLARIELRGDESISSAQISIDGRMIVAATGAAVKLFQIRRRADGDDIEIRTRPVDLPASIGSFGASSVGFSPDSKWLYAVRTSNLVTMAKIIPGATNKDRPFFHSQVIKLGRVQFKDEGLKSSKLGSYRRTINCVSYSSDSRILAIGDLAGTIDTWVLEGHESVQDLDGRDEPTTTQSSDEDSDSDSEDESDSRVIHGQKWIRNPSGSLPQLDSAILALSFKPHQPSPSLDSSIGLHATRHNPHPVSHELPPIDTKLIAVTASHQIIEFDIMSSKISDWSRRNPSAYLPESFTQIKDRVMGAFWDCNLSLNRQRFWLYGPTWLFMLDMTRDLNIIESQGKVGQIGDYDVREPLSSSAIAKRAKKQTLPLPPAKKRKRNTGAGDEKNSAETSIPTADLDSMEIDTGLISPTSDDEDNDGEELDSGNARTLTQLRRGADLPEAQVQDSELNSPTADTELTNTNLSQSPAHHTIFRYRSIFGIAPLHAPPQSEPSNPTSPHTPNSLEIILIERPLHDVDLAPRFDGRQEWTT